MTPTLPDENGPLDFRPPVFISLPHSFQLEPKTGLCARCNGGLLHAIHMEAAEAEYQKRMAAARKNGRHQKKTKQR